MALSNPFKQMTKAGLPDWRRDPALLDVQAKLAHAQQEAPGLAHNVEVTQMRLAAAEAARDDVAGLALIGRATDQEVAAAQAVADQARKALAEATFAVKENQRQQALLAPGLVQIEMEAKLAARDAFQAAFKPLVERLEDVLVQLGEANAALERVYDAALGQFPGPPAERDGLTFPTAAHTGYVIHRDYLPHPGTALDGWLRDIRQYLHPEA